MPTLPPPADRAEATGIDELANMRYWKEQRRDPREAMEKPKKDLQRERRTQSTLSEETRKEHCKDRLGSHAKTAKWALSRPKQGGQDL